VTPGTRLGPYEIVAAIGAGGMGDVYRARDTRLDRSGLIIARPDQWDQDGRVCTYRYSRTLSTLFVVSRGK